MKPWRHLVGLFHGSWYHVLNYSAEANALACLICAKRDLWKQNEAGDVVAKVQALLDEIDNAG